MKGVGEGLFDSECCSFYGRGATAGKGRFILSFKGLVTSETTLYSDPFLLNVYCQDLVHLTKATLAFENRILVHIPGAL